MKNIYKSPILEFLLLDRGSVDDVTKENSAGDLYIVGDANTDGSIRFQFTDPDTTAHIESRVNGVWNDTGLRFSSSSVRLGRDMIISAVAGFIETVNPSATAGHVRSLIPHIEFDELGTLEPPHMPILNALQSFDVFTGPAVGEIINTTIGQSLAQIPSRVLEQTVHEVGSIAATAPVTVSFYTGNDNTGFLFNRLNIPASQFIANQPLIIDYGDDFGFEGGISIFQEFTSTDPFSLKTNSSGDIITIHTGHELSETDVVLNEFILSNDLDIVFNNSLELVTSNRF